VITIVTQDATTGRVLMVAGADDEALERTRATGEMHYTSRKRGLWHKGATSGNRQRVVSLTPDCDGDAILARVDPLGPACHTGAVSCFDAPPPDALSALDATIAARVIDAAETDATPISYTRRLLADRNLRLKKLGEEAAELAVACADGNAERAIEEAADVLYHSLVALRALGVGLDDVRRAIERRR
jgi:phosphoribosyl-AMP cyclohydrolase / phosphoribosyl-ATP pyrophosphohydrolase